MDLPQSKEMVEDIKFFREKQLGLILGSDANSHHSMWVSSDINPRGMVLLGTYVLSQGDKPTFLTER